MRYAKCEHCKHWIRYDASRFECACALSGFDCAFEGRDGWKPKTYKELEKENAELRDTVEMYDFFYEGNGFKKRGLNNFIQVADYIDKLEKDLSELTITNNYQRVISDKNEQISALELKNERLENLVNILKHCNNYKHHHISGCDFEDSKVCNWQTKSKWELCE